MMMVPFITKPIHASNQKEAADALGISQSYISRLEKRIIRELKKKLED